MWVKYIGPLGQVYPCAVLCILCTSLSGSQALKLHAFARPFRINQSTNKSSTGVGIATHGRLAYFKEGATSD